MNSTIRSLLIASLLTITLLACSKPTPPPSTTIGLRDLPTDAIGFMAGDLQSESMKSFMGSPFFLHYMQTMKEMSTLEPSLKESMSTYWEVIEALGVSPKEGQTELPYSELLSYIRPSTKEALEGVFVYYAKSGTKPKELLAAAKKTLESKKFALSAVTLPGYEAFEFPLFPEGSPNAAAELYRDVLGISKIVFAANDTHLVGATVASAIEMFAKGPSGPSTLLEDALYKKFSAELDPGSAKPFKVGLDIKALVARTPALRELGQGNLPFSLLTAVGDASGSGMLFNSKTSVSPREGIEQQVANALAGSKSTSLPYPIAAAAAVGLTFDATVLERLLPIFGSDMPQAVQEQVKGYLPLVKSVSLGMAPSSSTSPVPEITISLTSSNPGELFKKLKELQSLAPLPPGMGLRAGTVEGIPTEFLPTPLGIKVHFWQDKEKVVIAGGDEALLAVAKPTNGLLENLPLVAETQKATPSPLFGMVINYERMAAMLVSINQTAAMFGQSGEMIPEAQLSTLKALGTIAFSLSYEPGVATWAYTMEFNNKP